MACYVRWALAVAVVVLVAAGGTAFADSAAIAVTTTTGTSDPVAGIPRIVTVGGTASAPERVYVKYRATGAPCASSASSDPGAVLSSFYAESVNGAFRLQDVVTWAAPGDVLFCTWLSTGNAATASVPFAQVVAFRAPKGSIAATVRPARPRRGRPIAIDVSGSTEMPATVYASVRTDDASPCAPTYAAQAGEVLIEAAPVAGAFTFQLKTRQVKVGDYLVCTWLARSAADPTPIAGPQPVAFAVAPLPRGCVVPTVGSDRRPVTVRRRIRRAHCSVGRSLRVTSRRVRKGAVVRLTRRPHARLDPDTPVGLVISTGPPTRHMRR